MRIDVLFFAVAREKAGTERMSVELPAGSTVASLWKRLADDRPALSAILPNCRAAIDETFAPSTAVLREGAVVAVLPPVSGG